ncbi:MAG: type II secretion system protein [Candidatus Kappaea frigidicola]|nr:type II secretion system protein [Candidatus Kappaea frigidicola]
MRRARSFTLIELMVVVALISILVTIAVPNYQRFQLRAKVAEANHNLGAIRGCLEVYEMENESYVLCTLHPATVPSAARVFWEDTAVPQSWIDIGFKPVGQIRYSYEVQAGASGIGTSYIIIARGDLDGDGVESVIQLDQNGNMTSANPLE